MEDLKRVLKYCRGQQPISYVIYKSKDELPPSSMLIGKDIERLSLQYKFKKNFIVDWNEFGVIVDVSLMPNLPRHLFVRYEDVNMVVRCEWQGEDAGDFYINDFDEIKEVMWRSSANPTEEQMRLYCIDIESQNIGRESNDWDSLDSIKKFYSTIDTLELCQRFQNYGG